MRGSPSLLAVLALTACGRLGFDGVARDGAPSVDGSFGDGRVDAVVGDASPPFAGVTRIAELDVAGEEDDDPTLTEDQLEIFFISSRPGGSGLGDIWWSRRVTTADPWAVPMNLGVLNTAGDETTPELTPDGLTLLFARGPDMNDHDIYLVSRPDRNAAWSTPVAITELDVPGDAELSAAPAPDLLALVLDNGSEMLGSTRPSTTSAWSTPVAIPELVVAGLMMSQAWLGDTAIYLTVSGSPSGQDLWYAQRTGPLAFTAPVRLDELSTDALDSDPWLAADLSTDLLHPRRRDLRRDPLVRGRSGTGRAAGSDGSRSAGPRRRR